MSGEWIKVRRSLFDDPKVLSMADQLGLQPWAVVGGLCRLWLWGGEHTDDGILRGLSAEAIDRILDSPGFADAMIVVGWLEVTDDGLKFPKWERHNSNGPAERARRADRKPTRKPGRRDRGPGGKK